MKWYWFTFSLDYYYQSSCRVVCLVVIHSFGCPNCPPPPSCFLRRSNPFREKVPTDILTCVPNIWTRPRLIPSPHGLLNEPLFKQKNKTKKNSNHLGDEKLLKNKKIRRRSAPYGERRSWVTIDMSHIQNFLYRKKRLKKIQSQFYC
jgi:hypothetical protein